MSTRSGLPAHGDEVLSCDGRHATFEREMYGRWKNHHDGHAGCSHRSGLPFEHRVSGHGTPQPTHAATGIVLHQQPRRTGLRGMLWFIQRTVHCVGPHMGGPPLLAERMGTRMDKRNHSLPASSGETGRTGHPLRLVGTFALQRMEATHPALARGNMAGRTDLPTLLPFPQAFLAFR